MQEEKKRLEHKQGEKSSRKAKELLVVLGVDYTRTHSPRTAHCAVSAALAPHHFWALLRRDRMEHHFHDSHSAATWRSTHEMAIQQRTFAIAKFGHRCKSNSRWMTHEKDGQCRIRPSQTQTCFSYGLLLGGEFYGLHNERPAKSETQNLNTPGGCFS